MLIRSLQRPASCSGFGWVLLLKIWTQLNGNLWITSDKKSLKREVYICFFSMCWPSGTNDLIPVSLVPCLFLHPSVFSLLWPSPRISPKLWVQASCPAPWLLLQQWPLRLPRTRWLSVQQLLRTTHTITYCKARLSATPSWDPPPGPFAPPTGQSSSPLTDTSLTSASQEQPLQKHTVKIQT